MLTMSISFHGHGAININKRCMASCTAGNVDCMVQDLEGGGEEAEEEEEEPAMEN